jgi:enamine deaminase RidA (YjgF/YER057c/UK114 family)
VKELGGIWRARLEKHYPAVALLEVKGLVDRGAVIEMEATAVISGGGGG